MRDMNNRRTKPLTISQWSLACGLLEKLSYQFPALECFAVAWSAAETLRGVMLLKPKMPDLALSNISQEIQS